MKESDLAKKVVEWLKLQHWEIYQEVQIFRAGSIVDIIAERCGIYMNVEVKTSLTFAVIEQAQKNQFMFNYTCVAVPFVNRKRQGRWLALDVCEKRKIGVIEVDAGYSGGYIEYGVQPQLTRNNKDIIERYVISSLTEAHKNYCEAGSANGGHLTPYRQTMDSIKSILKREGPCTLKQIMFHLEQHHYCSDNSAKGSIRKALYSFEDWCQEDCTTKPYKYSIR